MIKKQEDINTLADCIRNDRYAWLLAEMLAIRQCINRTEDRYVKQVSNVLIEYLAKKAKISFQRRITDFV